MATTTAQPSSTPAANSPKRDFRQEVTDQIVRMLEEGVAPWQKPWEPGRTGFGMPVNPTTEKAYRGGNAIYLMATAIRKDYEDPRWMTYKQASDRGWQVRKGEKGTQIEFWEFQPNARERDGGPQPDGEAGEKEGRHSQDCGHRCIHRVYTVFNAKQIEGIPAYQQKERTAFEAVQAGEQILKNSGARIRHDQEDRAFYNRTSDSIHLPPKSAFKEACGYYGTALHELAHWSGHPERLNRQTLNESYRFGDPNYAKEELRAELASVFLAAERGIPHDPAQHAAYVGSWIKVLKEDKNEIFRAAHDASAAAEFLLVLERGRSIVDETLSTGPTLDSETSAGTREAAYEQESANLKRDREDLNESVSEGAAQQNIGQSAKHKSRIQKNAELENTAITARMEPDTRTVNVEEKRTGAQHRSPVEMLAEPAKNTKETEPAKNTEWNAARTIAANTLGQSARTVEAFVDSGNYRGLIIGETERYLVQRQSAGMAVLHQKDLLDRQPQVGEAFSINYSNGKGLVREARDRAKAHELGR